MEHEDRLSKLVLIVDDDEAMRSLLTDELLEMGIHVMAATNGREAFERIAAASPDLVVTDFQMPVGGLGYVRQLRHLTPCPIILLTAFGDVQTREQTLACGVNRYFDKPVQMVRIRTAIRELLNSEDKLVQGIPP